jgi:pantoate--beta-alanine ligase
MEMLKAENDVQPEYFEIVDGKTMLPAGKDSATIVALTAVRVGKTRLIDNMLVK